MEAVSIFAQFWLKEETYRDQHALGLLASATATAESQQHHQDADGQQDEESILVVLLFLSK